MNPLDPLRYPPHFPPSTRWKRFFVGVRGLGPDMSFLKDLESLQGARTAQLMSAWGGGERQVLAEALGVILARHCNWPGPHFLPGDEVAVIFGGPTHGWMDETDATDAIAAMEECVGARMPPGFWEDAGSRTFGHLVDQLALAGRRALHDRGRCEP